MKSPIYYIKVWRKLFLMSLKRSRSYKTELVSRLIRALTIILLQILMAQSLFSMTDEIAGWTRPQYYLLMGTYSLVMYISWGFFAVNLFRLNEKISKGELDYSLTKPTGNYFELVFGEFFIDDMIPGLGGLVMVLLFIFTQPVTLVGSLFYVISLLIGIVIWLSISTIFATVAFHNFKLKSLDLLPSLSQLGNVPSNAWGKWEIVTKVLFPVAFITVLPAQTLWRGLDINTLLYSFVIMLVFYTLSRILWTISIRKYESGG